jgi:diguanylate cyclase (GGDEF)-like protein/PAS domain S-box-containing protein
MKRARVALNPAARTLGTLTKVVVAALVISVTATVLMLLHAGRIQDEEAAEASLLHFQGLMTLHGKHLSSHVTDYAHWDEAIQHVIIKPDADWWDANPGEHAISRIGVSLSLAATADDDLSFVTTKAGTRRDVSSQELTPSLKALLSTARQRTPSLHGHEAVTIGIVEADGILYLAAASRFLREGTLAPAAEDPDALLVFGLALEDRMLPEIAEIMGAVELRRLTEAPAKAVKVPLILADGTLAGIIAWTPPAPGRSVITGVIPLMSVAFLFVAGLTLVFTGRARTLARQLDADESLRRELARRNESILDVAGEGIFGIDRNGVALFANPAALSILGYTRDEFLRHNVNETIQCRAFDQPPMPEGESPMRRILADGRAVTSDTEWFQRKDGSCFPVEYVVTAISEGETVTGAVVVFRDIAKRRETEEEIIYRANYDALTGLPNRNLLIDRLGQEIKLARREKKPVGLLFIDLDKFKEVNDSQGHRAGDLLLRQVAQRLRDSLRETDTVGRLSGDEFVILLPHAHDAADPAKVADKVLRTLAEAFDLEGQEVRIGASIGIARFPDDGGDVVDLMHKADLAMYQAKSAGRGTYCFSASSHRVQEAGTEPHGVAG